MPCSKPVPAESHCGQAQCQPGQQERWPWAPLIWEPGRSNLPTSKWNEWPRASPSPASPGVEFVDGIRGACSRLSKWWESFGTGNMHLTQAREGQQKPKPRPWWGAWQVYRLLPKATHGMHLWEIVKVRRHSRDVHQQSCPVYEREK